MTSEENKVMESLVAAWNGYLDLPKQHADDVVEFRHAIHSLQRLIGIREVRRLNPGRWVNEALCSHVLAESVDGRMKAVVFHADGPDASARMAEDAALARVRGMDMPESDRDACVKALRQHRRCDLGEWSLQIIQAGLV